MLRSMRLCPAALPLAVAMASMILTSTAAASAGRTRLPWAFQPTATALLARSSHHAAGAWAQQQQSTQQQRPAAARSMAGTGASRLPSVRGGASFFPFASSTRLFSSSVFGYPDAAEEAVGKAQSYLQTLLDAPESGRPVVRGWSMMVAVNCRRDRLTHLLMHAIYMCVQVPIELVSKEKFEAWLQQQDPRTQALMAFKVWRSTLSDFFNLRGALSTQ